MALRLINVGSQANDKSGDPIRTAFIKVNQNFTDIHNTPVQVGATGATGPMGPQGIPGNPINALSDIPDVNVTDLTNGSVLVYTASTSLWKATSTLGEQNMDGGQF